jgi:hypothetical protein
MDLLEKFIIMANFKADKFSLEKRESERSAWYGMYE